MDLSPVVSLAARLGCPLATAQTDNLERFLTDLYAVNESRNLTRVALADAPIRHVCDSMLLCEFLPARATVLDIGCGPGFPAWVIALARPDLAVVAMDSSAKMHEFLSRHGLPNLKPLLQRGEEKIDRERFDVVTGRAIAPFSIQAELSAAWVKVGGLFCPLRTPAEETEIGMTNVGVLGLRLASMEHRELPGSDAVRLVPLFEKVRPTPTEYPRPWARMKSRPLGRS